MSIIIIIIIIIIIVSCPLSVGVNTDTFRLPIMLPIKGDHSNSSGVDEME
jgi:hypothetical protein